VITDRTSGTSFTRVSYREQIGFGFVTPLVFFNLFSVVIGLVWVIYSDYRVVGQHWNLIGKINFFYRRFWNLQLRLRNIREYLKDGQGQSCYTERLQSNYAHAPRRFIPPAMLANIGKFSSDDRIDRRSILLGDS